MVAVPRILIRTRAGSSTPAQPWNKRSFYVHFCSFIIKPELARVVDSSPFVALAV